MKQGWYWNSRSTTSWLLSCGWGQFWFDSNPPQEVCPFVLFFDLNLSQSLQPRHAIGTSIWWLSLQGYMMEIPLHLVRLVSFYYVLFAFAKVQSDPMLHLTTLLVPNPLVSRRCWIERLWWVSFQETGAICDVACWEWDWDVAVPFQQMRLSHLPHC